MSRIPARPVVLGCMALALGGCGGAARDPEEVVKEFIEAYDRGDPRACRELVTDGYVKAITREDGERGRELCEQQLAGIAPADVKLDLIPSVDDRGDVVDVVVRLRIDGRQEEQSLRLRRQDGEYRVDRLRPA